MEIIHWNQFAIIISLLVLSVFPRNTNGDIDWNLDEDTNGWIDPHSMLEASPTKKIPVPDKEVVYEACEKAESDCSVVENSLTECSDELVKLQKDLERQKELNKKLETVAAKEQPFFEQYLRHILVLFTKVKDGLNVGHYEADISLPVISYDYLSHYVTKQNVSVQEVHSILLRMVTKVRWIRGDDELDDFDDGSYFSSGLLYYLNVGGVASVITVALLQAVSLLRRVRMSLGRFVFLFFFTMILACFVISVPWTWWHLYKKKVAERMAALSKRPPECTNQMNSFWKTFWSYFHFQTDECQKYYEQLEIDPLWEVPPTQAVAVTFVRFFLEPAKHIGQAIREFMVSAFEGLPIFLWLPVYAFIILLLVLVLFCLGRYRVSMPFMSIEPSHSDHSSRNVAALQDQVQQLQLENQDMRRRLLLLPDERGDGRRTAPSLDETCRRVQDVERNDLEMIDRRNKHADTEAPGMLENNIPVDSECVNNAVLPSSTVDEIRLDEVTPVSSSATNPPSPDEIGKDEMIAELTTEKPSIANDKEPSASVEDADENNEQRTETNGEDLLRSYVTIETICTSEDLDLNKNLNGENKPSAADANTNQVEPLAKLVKNSMT